MNTKHCTSCRRDLPKSFYGPYRRAADGLNYHCIECRRWKLRSNANAKFGISRPDRRKYSDCIFHFDTQNETILRLAILRQNTSFPAFDISTNAQYTVQFETLTPQGFQVWIKGSPIPAVRLYGFPSDDMIPSLIKWLHTHNIRLEQSELSLYETIALLYQKNSL